MRNLYTITKDEFETTSLNLDDYVHEQVKRIVTYVDEMTLKNVPIETLLKIRKKIDEELNNRGGLRE